MPGRALRYTVWFGFSFFVYSFGITHGTRADSANHLPVQISIYENLPGAPAWQLDSADRLAGAFGIYENVPKTLSWQIPEGAHREQFEWPALGFVRLPVKYNTRGIEVDRTGPFALLAETTLKE